MKSSLMTIGILVLMSGIQSVAAYADNPDVQDALKRRSDLSSFYQALVNTGVDHELQPNRTYTVFAPTNEAMTRIRQDQYPCFYQAECRQQVAQIVRNHIVPGEIYMDDTARQHGGVYSLGGRFVNIGEPSRNDYAIEGHDILYTSWFGGGILYKINGVIANHRELAAVQYPEYAYVPMERVTTTERTIADPACGPAGCPDAVTQTTTVTRTIEPALIEPAR